MRQCFITPIPEIELATKFLDAAGDALLQGDNTLAAKLIVDSDISAIYEYIRRIVGKLSADIHRQTTLPKLLPKAERVKPECPLELLKFGYLKETAGIVGSVESESYPAHRETYS